MDNPTTYVLLIRHGENDWVGENRLAGRTPEVHLNETGRKQSARIVETLSDQELSAVYSSPMERCLETAQPVADAHGLAVTPESGVLEVDYGGLAGRQHQGVGENARMATRPTCAKQLSISRRRNPVRGASAGSGHS